jgi:predicted dehydrogenase
VTTLLRWGILGAAAIARLEVGPAIVASARSRLVAVASRRLDVAERLGAELGDVRAASSYRALVEDPEIDVVYVALPNAVHAEWAIAALEAGKHVLCEKPLGMTEAEARAMTEAARAHGRVLVEGFMWRQNPRVQRIRELLGEGALGEPRHLRARYAVRSAALDDPAIAASTFRLSPQLGGGALADLGCYCVDALLLAADREPLSVTSTRTSLPGLEIETTVAAQLDFPGGAVGQLYATMEAPGRSELEILGTRGRIRMPAAFRTRPSDERLELELELGGTRTHETWPYESQYGAEIAHLEAVILDGAPPLVTLEESVRTARTVDRIRSRWATAIG